MTIRHRYPSSCSGDSRQLMLYPRALRSIIISSCRLPELARRCSRVMSHKLAVAGSPAMVDSFSFSAVTEPSARINIRIIFRLGHAECIRSAMSYAGLLGSSSLCWPMRQNSTKAETPRNIWAIRSRRTGLPSRPNSAETRCKMVPSPARSYPATSDLAELDEGRDAPEHLGDSLAPDGVAEQAELSGDQMQDGPVPG